MKIEQRPFQWFFSTCQKKSVFGYPIGTSKDIGKEKFSWENFAHFSKSVHFRRNHQKWAKKKILKKNK